jgi:chaperone modulatory protein CbpM
MFLKKSSTLPARSGLIAWAQLTEQTEASRERVTEIVEMGWIVPVRTAENELLFKPDDVYRIRKLERICRDFELTTIGGSIIVDLLERIETLEQQVAELKRLL